MEAFVRKGSSSDITKGAGSYPIHYKVSILIFNLLLFWVFITASSFAIWKMLPSGTTLNNFAEVLINLGKWGARIYALIFIICLLVIPLIRMLSFVFQNHTPQCSLSAVGITFRDGTLVTWEDMTENTYNESQYGNADGILIRNDSRKWGITMPNVSAKEYISLCDDYSRNHDK